MLTLLRTLAKAITGKVDALEFALGIFFGVLLGLIPAGEVDPGTGLLGLNTLWLLVLVVFLVLKASIPMAILTGSVFKLLAMLFLDSAAYGFGQAVLPDGLAVALAGSLPGLQLHTFWGFGTAVFGLALATLSFVAVYPLMKKRLPLWRERFGRTKFAKAMGNFFVFKALGRLIG